MDAILAATDWPAPTAAPRAGLATAEDGPDPPPPMGAIAGPRPRSACDWNGLGRSDV